MDSSSSKPHDSSTSQSAGTCSPARIHSTSPSTMSSASTSSLRPSRRTRLRDLTRMDSLSSVRLDLSSVTTPMRVLTMMTKPKTASFHRPVSSTTIMAARMMPLNSVNTFAAMICPTVRVVFVDCTFTWPCATRSATCPAVSPRSSTAGMDCAVPDCSDVDCADADCAVMDCADCADCADIDCAVVDCFTESSLALRPCACGAPPSHMRTFIFFSCSSALMTAASA